MCYTGEQYHPKARRHHEHRPHPCGFPAGPGPYGRGHRSGLPPDLPGAGGRAYRHRDGQRQGPVLSGPQDPQSAASGAGGASCRGADLRQRRRLHGGSRLHGRRAVRRRFHRHQHGLSRGQSGLQRRRLRPDEGPGAGCTHCRGGGEGLPGAGDGENAPWLG